MSPLITRVKAGCSSKKQMTKKMDIFRLLQSGAVVKGVKSFANQGVPLVLGHPRAIQSNDPLNSISETLGDFKMKGHQL